MTEYNPDYWVVLEIERGEEKIHKILATWGGSYAYGESWKMNSGITEVEDCGPYFKVYGYSGSVYKCHKGMQGMNGYGMSILNSFREQKAEDLKIEVVEMQSIFKQYKK